MIPIITMGPRMQAHYYPRYTSIHTLDICRVSISPAHKLPHGASYMLADHTHPLYPKIRHRYGDVLKGQHDKRKEGLWLMCSSNMLQRERVVRSWARRRVQQAVVEDLERRGFNNRGQPLKIAETTHCYTLGTSSPNNKRTRTAVDTRRHGLIGTADVHVLNKAVEADYQEVQRQAGLVVNEIIKICGNSDYFGKNLDGRMSKTDPGEKSALTTSLRS